MAELDVMALEWHEASDHARDGDAYGSPLCNCRRIAARALALGWTSTRRAHQSEDDFGDESIHRQMIAAKARGEGTRRNTQQRKPTTQGVDRMSCNCGNDCCNLTEFAATDNSVTWVQASSTENKPTE